MSKGGKVESELESEHLLRLKMPVDFGIIQDLIRTKAHNNQERAQMLFLVGKNPNLCNGLRKHEVMAMLRAGLPTTGAAAVTDRSAGKAAEHFKPAPQQAGQSGPELNAVEYLVQNFGDMLRTVHAEEAPGGVRVGPLQPHLSLTAQMCVVGRDRTYQCWVAMMARIYKCWQRRSANVAEWEFRRGLAHLLLLSSPGTGKTTVLVWLLRWLRAYLKELEAELLDFIAWAMYSESLSHILPEQADLVREFLALDVPEGKLFLLLVLVDEGNRATGFWDHDGEVNEDLTWLKQFLSTIINTNMDSKWHGKGHLVAYAVAERASHLEGGAGHSPAGGKHRRYLASRRAPIRSQGCVEECSFHAGRQPPPLVLCADLIGTKGSALMGHVQHGREWNPGVHHRILGLKMNSVSALVTDVSNVAFKNGFWPRLRENVGMNVQVLKRILAAIALDQTVLRMERIVPEYRALTATWGSEEEQGAIQLDLPVPGGGLPSGLSSAAQQAQSSAHARTSSSHSLGAVSAGASAAAMAAAALQHQTLTELEEVPSQAGTKGGPKRASPPGSPSPQDTKRPKLGAAAASPSSATPQSTAVSPSKYVTPVATLRGVAELSRPVEAAGPSSPRLSAQLLTSIRGVSGSGTVQRHPVGLCEADVKGSTPARLAMAVVDHMCPVPTVAPGTEAVQPSMGVLAFTTLLRETVLLRSEELSVFSDELVRESALDREFADAMAPCQKLEMLATLGRRTFRLPELFSGLAMDPHLVELEFLVPPGRLSAGEGRRDAHALSKAQTLETIECICAAIVAAADRLASNPCDSVAVEALEIGCIGVGNKGKHSMVVFVEAEDRSRAWGLVV
ncbi:g10653 [Coccomyxa elongata]